MLKYGPSAKEDSYVVRHQVPRKSRSNRSGGATLARNHHGVDSTAGSGRSEPLPYVSGGGVVVAEAEDARSLYEMVEPFKPLVEFEVEPSVNVIEALAISLDIEEWVDSVRELAGERANKQ